MAICRNLTKEEQQTILRINSERRWSDAVVPDSMVEFDDSVTTKSEYNAMMRWLYENKINGELTGMVINRWPTIYFEHDVDAMKFALHYG